MPIATAAAAKSPQSCPTLCDPLPWDSPGKNTGVGCHFLLQCMKVKSQSEVAQSCPTLSDPMDCSPLGSSIHGIFQARVLEWGAIAFFTNAYWRYVIVPLFCFHNRNISNALILPSFASASCSSIPLTFLILHSGASQIVLVVKNPPANAGDARDADSIPGSGRSLGEGMATHSSILAWRMSWTEKSGGLQSTRSHRVGHN